jgi:Zn2+/Cd2+-exporting ATPase
MMTHTTRTWRVKGLDCPDCAASLESAVRELPDIEVARLNYGTGMLLVETNGDAPSVPDAIEPRVRQIVEAMGYELIDEAAGPQSPPQSLSERLWRRRRDVTTAASGTLIALALLSRLLGMPQVVGNAFYAAAIVIGGFYVAKAGWVALRVGRRLDMNALMSIAASGAMVLGEFAEGAVTIFLFAIGELLESYSADRARNAIRELMALTPDVAWVLRDGEQPAQMPLSAVRTGDRVLVRPGDRVPVDGKVLEGTSGVDQSPITGESIPVQKLIGDEVFAGTINGTGALVVETTRAPGDSTLARILRLVEEAQAAKSPSERFVDRFARIYTPIVMAVALLIALVPPALGFGALSTWVYRALVLLVISCPCALVISTPVTVVSALARAARSGVLIKGGQYLEALGGLQAVAFDKTGTMTLGKPQVIYSACDLHRESDDGIAESCIDCQELIARAAAVEERSEHALAQAVLQHAEELGVRNRYPAAEEVVATPGMGIEGLVAGHRISIGSHAFCHRYDDVLWSDPLRETEPRELCDAIATAEAMGQTVLVIQDDCCRARCYLAVSDTLREGVSDVVAALKSSGIAHTAMLTGDNPHIAQQVAGEVGVDEVYAGLLPQDKVELVAALRERFGGVAMIGDGVNDAPAMAKASVGIAMGVAGSDVALETADIALMSDDLSKLPWVIRLSRQTLRIVRTNIALSLGIKALFLALAIAGVATLWMAVLADMGTSLLVSLNGLRMLRFRE